MSWSVLNNSMESVFADEFMAVYETERQVERVK